MRTLGGFLLLSFLASLASCGGSSSETPPPLEPLPVNVHYNRSATSLPGEAAVTAPVSSSDALPEEPPDTIAPASATPTSKPAPPLKSQF